ncbi:MAG: hypothetical protein HY738_22755 [Bacteroidia bacterium]|nr:hypothetical protein [Bacteroidia bacterium]
MSSYLETEAKKFQMIIAPYIKKDPWFYYSFDIFSKSLTETYYEIPGILQLMNERMNYLKKQPELMSIFE